jgi:uncharacterized protein involved in tolerance to divalent cations
MYNITKVNEAISDKKVDAKIIADKMRKDKSTKGFADKVEKMGKVSQKDLDNILPDYVTGGTIEQFFKESVNESSEPLKLKGIKINKKSDVTFVLEVSFLIGDEVVMSYLTTGTSQDAQKLKSKVEKAFNAGKIVSPSGIGYYAYNESVNEDYDGPAILKTGDKNALKVGEKITMNTGGKKKEYKVVKSNGNGDFVLHLVEGVNEASKPTIKVVNNLKNEEGIQIVVTKTTDGDTMYGGFVVRGKLQKMIPVGANDSKEGVKKRALQIWDEFGKKLGENKKVNEGKYDADLDKIEAAVKNALSFMNVGAELRKAGIKYDFSTSMIPMYMIKVSGTLIAIVNKKHANGPERVVNDIAIGVLN